MEVILSGTSQADVAAALKVLRQMVKKAGLIEELKHRAEYMKPSKKRKYKQEQAVIKKKRDAKLIAKKKLNYKHNI
jgi:ribosomal protein S21